MLKELIRALVEIAKAIRGENGNGNGGQIPPFTVTDSPKWIVDQDKVYNNPTEEDFLPIGEELEEYVRNNSENWNRHSYYCVYDHKPDMYNFHTLVIVGKEIEAFLSCYTDAVNMYECVPGKWIIERGG